jgi:hypothetical protein
MSTLATRRRLAGGLTDATPEGQCRSDRHRDGESSTARTKPTWTPNGARSSRFPRNCGRWRCWTTRTWRTFRHGSGTTTPSCPSNCAAAAARTSGMGWNGQRRKARRRRPAEAATSGPTSSPSPFLVTPPDRLTRGGRPHSGSARLVARARVVARQTSVDGASGPGLRGGRGPLRRAGRRVTGPAGRPRAGRRHPRAVRRHRDLRSQRKVGRQTVHRIPLAVSGRGRTPAGPPGRSERG